MNGVAQPPRARASRSARAADAHGNLPAVRATRRVHAARGRSLAPSRSYKAREAARTRDPGPRTGGSGPLAAGAVDITGRRSSGLGTTGSAGAAFGLAEAAKTGRDRRRGAVVDEGVRDRSERATDAAARRPM